MLLWLAAALHLLLPPAAAADDFCVPSQPPPPPLPSPPAALGGAPPAVQAALRPYLRRCQYLPLPPPATATLELCLLQSARVIDKDNFSIFLGYFERWGGGGAGGGAAQEYTGGNAWSCAGGVERSVTLRIGCSGSEGSSPAIAQWVDSGACHHEAHLVLPGNC